MAVGLELDIQFETHSIDELRRHLSHVCRHKEDNTFGPALLCNIELNQMHGGAATAIPVQA